MTFRRKGLAAVAMAAVCMAGLVPAAYAGQFDYVLEDIPPDTFRTRNVAHDYSYLRGTIGFPGTTTCVARGGGVSFCASGSANHSYSDSCNLCLSYYKQKSSILLDVTVHDEWR
ncbi:MAG: hypothetical protein WKF96_25365 [Solirubrobacteraceae bacterium]